MSQLNCLKCKQSIDAQYDQCPHCGERVTLFQRTYSTRLLDGKYQIIDRLGVGGMGEIFKVRHIDRKSTRLNSSHPSISYAVFCLKKKTKKIISHYTLYIN